MIKVLRPADSPTGEWLEERVDLAADYREAFGEAPSDPTQLAIQADTDNTDSTSRAAVADLTFAPLMPRRIAIRGFATGRAERCASFPEPRYRRLNPQFCSRPISALNVPGTVLGRPSRQGRGQ